MTREDGAGGWGEGVGMVGVSGYGLEYGLNLMGGTEAQQ